MASPRIFLSSTYYDLKQVRNDIGNSIEQLGYQVVRHERSDIPYDGSRRLEESCYDEIATCDIVVCVIGNSFGTRSDINALSITMNELERAIKDRKIVYVYVENSVLIENRTYRKNRDNKDFVPANVDNVEIHRYIANLQERMGNTKPIMAFETAEDIIISLKSQLAGLFQSLLSGRIASSTIKDVYSLHTEVESLKQVVESVSMKGQEFFVQFRGTVISQNPIIAQIEKCLGITQFRIIVKSIYALDEAMEMLGFSASLPDGTKDEVGFGLPVEGRVYSKNDGSKAVTLAVGKEAFKESGEIAVITDKNSRENLVKYSEEEIDNGMPF